PREDRRLDAIGRGASLHEAHRSLDRLLHYFAELAGGLDLALAWNGDSFDRQQLPADLGPGEASHGTDLVLFLADAITVTPDTQEAVQVLLCDDDVLVLALENLAQRLARDLGEFTLERANAGFARVKTK